MKILEVNIDKSIDHDEFRKIVSFISEDITSYSMEEGKIILRLVNEADNVQIKNEVIRMASKFVSTSELNREVFVNKVERDYHSLYETKIVHVFENGMISLQKEALFLYKYFENIFRNIAIFIDDQCIEKSYPVILPINQYKKTGYLTNSPQYSMFCCSACENIQMLEQLDKYADSEAIEKYLNRPAYALSPSACFHTYLEYENQILDKNQTVTFTQSVFRNEGRFNYTDFGRLRDYHVREIVLLGNMEYVIEKRKKIVDQIITFIKEINLCGDISIASDPFIMPKMQKFKKIQVTEASKYEMHLNYEKEQKLSVASFNLHGTAFTHPFNIKIKECQEAVTGCVGFGLERWVLAFLKQYGVNVKNWPQKIKEVYYNEKR